MKAFIYQRKGCGKGKREMEDRAVAGGNVLASGYHAVEDARDGVYGVFDGVGGLPGSAFAAAAAARALSEVPLPVDEERLRGALTRLHGDLVRRSRTATTATGVALCGGRTLLFHIGNTRLFGLYDGYIRPLTADQTRYEELLRAGNAPESIDERARCTLNACLGVREEFLDSLEIRDVTCSVSRSTKLLLTSDGIHDCLSLDELEAALAVPSSEAVLSAVADLAVRKGSRDDLTVMVIER